MATPGESLEQQAEARYRAVDYDGAIAIYEQAYRAHREVGDRLGAARAARITAWLHGNVHGDWAVAGGWIGRARTLLEEAGEDSAEHGWVLMLQAVPDGDPDRQEALCRQAWALGRRHGDVALEFEAHGYVALMLVQSGRVEEGLLLFDEVMAAVCSGEVQDVYVIEGTMCGMFLACERANDVVRAEQWLRTAEDVVNRPHMVGVSAFCRAHYGGILTEAGRWAEAETELTEAARLLEVSYRECGGPPSFVLPTSAPARAGSRRPSNCSRASNSGAKRCGRWPPSTWRGAMWPWPETSSNGPWPRTTWRPSPGRSSPFWLMWSWRAGAIHDARRAAERLADLAESRGGHYLRAAAALAQGKVCVAEGSGDARGCIEDALSSFSQAQMPVHLAQARLELARAVAGERPEVAVAEATAALEAFERLQAARDVDAAAALLRALGGPARTGPRGQETLTKRESEVLELVGHGLSNPEIGDRLYISRKTVEHHVGRILTKLGLRSRAEAAAYAARSAATRSGGK